MGLKLSPMDNSLLATLSKAELARRVLIFGTALISVMGIAVTLPVLPAMAKDMNLDATMLGVLIYSFTLPGIFFAPICGILADRLGRKAVLAPCLTLFALAGFAASFADSLTTLLFWRMLQGIGASSLGVLYAIIVGDNYRDDASRLRIMGYAATSLSLGAAIFPALGGLMGEIGWPWTLRISLLALPLALLTLYTPIASHEKKGDMKKYAVQVRTYLVHYKTLFHFGITFCAFCILYGPLISYFPLLATQFYAASPMQIGFLFALSSLGTVLATLLLAPITLALSQRLVASLGAVFFVLSMIWLCIWPIEWSYWALSVPVLCYGIGQGLLYPITMTSLSTVAPFSARGALMAVNGTTLRLSQSVAPLVCGFLFGQGGYDWVFLFGIGISLCMLALVFATFTSQK